MKAGEVLNLLLVVSGVTPTAGTAEAQLSSTVTVVPAPAMSFANASSKSNRTILTDNLMRANCNMVHPTGITIRSLNSLDIELKTGDRSRRINVQLGRTTTLTTKELQGAEEVQVIYMGS